MEDSTALMDQHREKLEEIRQLGVDPYAYKYSPTHTTQEIREQFAEVGDQPDETKSVRVAGRIMTKRDHGKSGFAHCKMEAAVSRSMFVKMPSGKKPIKFIESLMSATLLALAVLFSAPEPAKLQYW